MRLVAGEFAGGHGPVTEIAARPLYMDVALAPGAEFEIGVPSGHRAIAYVFEGEGEFGGDAAEEGQSVSAVQLVVLGSGDRLHVRSNPGVRFMLMCGAPFGEPIFPYGPFVMNTQQEIQQVLADLRNGTFVQS